MAKEKSKRVTWGQNPVTRQENILTKKFYYEDIPKLRTRCEYTAD